MKVTLSQVFINSLKPLPPIEDKSTESIRRRLLYSDSQKFKPDKEYMVLSIEGDHYRLLGEIGGPLLYPKILFLITETEPTLDWTEDFTPSFNVQGFFENYFDNNPDEVKILNEYLTRLQLPLYKIVTEDGRVKTIRRKYESS